VNVARLIDDLLFREGGYVNHPNDKGGPTNYGITQATLERHRGHMVTVAAVQDLSEAEAREIYLARYYERPRINQLPELWQAVVFDWGVNSGPATAVRHLQQLLAEMGLEPGPIDGIIGPRTIRAAQETIIGPMREYLQRRREFVETLVWREPPQAVFLDGWRARIDGLEADLRV
jgi:lysozyme family protein